MTTSLLPSGHRAHPPCSPLPSRAGCSAPLPSVPPARAVSNGSDPPIAAASPHFAWASPMHSPCTPSVPAIPSPPCRSHGSPVLSSLPVLPYDHLSLSHHSRFPKPNSLSMYRPTCRSDRTVKYGSAARAVLPTAIMAPRSTQSRQKYRSNSQ